MAAPVRVEAGNPGRRFEAERWLHRVNIDSVRVPPSNAGVARVCGLFRYRETPCVRPGRLQQAQRAAPPGAAGVLPSLLSADSRCIGAAPARRRRAAPDARAPPRLAPRTTTRAPPRGRRDREPWTSTSRAKAIGGLKGLLEEDDQALSLSAFETLEKEFQDVLATLAGDESLDEFRAEYEKTRPSGFSEIS